MKRFWRVCDFVVYGAMAVAFVMAVKTIVFGQEPAGTKRAPLGPVRFALNVDRVIDGGNVEGWLGIPWGPLERCEIHLAGYDAKPGKPSARALQEVIDLGDCYLESSGLGEFWNGKAGESRLLGRLWVKSDKTGELIDAAKWMRARGHTADPPAQVKPSGKAGARSVKRQPSLEQLARRPWGDQEFQAPPGSTGFGGAGPACNQSRAGQMSLRRN